MTENEAIQLCRSGDPHGLKTLFDLHREKVFRLSWRMLGTPHDAEDAVQEVFLKVYRVIGQWRGDSAFSTWLYRLTANHCLDTLRRRKVVAFHPLENVGEPSDPTDRTGLGGRTLGPVVEKALQELPESQRACLMMREMEDLSYEEIAESLGLRLGTVKSNIHRAKSFLKAKLQRSGYSPEDYR